MVEPVGSSDEEIKPPLGEVKEPNPEEVVVVVVEDKDEDGELPSDCGPNFLRSAVVTFPRMRNGWLVTEAMV